MARRIKVRRKRFRKRKREAEIHYLTPGGPNRHPLMRGPLTVDWEPKKS